MEELMAQGNDGFIRIRTRDDKPVVSGRELHEWLGVGTAYKDWFPRMCEYGFTDGIDFNPLKNEQVRFEGDREVRRVLDDHELTTAMGKEVSMLQRTERGKQARRYFVKLDDAWNTPEVVMARALRMANVQLEVTNLQLQNLQIEHATMAFQNQIMAPKAEYFDELVDRNLLTSFRETANELGVGPKKLIQFLVDKHYLYRDNKKNLMPYAKKNDGLFEVKECFNERTRWRGVQTLVTPKGRETLRLLARGLGK